MATKTRHGGTSGPSSAVAMRPAHWRKAMAENTERTRPGGIVGTQASRSPRPGKRVRLQLMQSADSTAHFTPEERWHMIAVNAYFRAEKRGFVGGDPAQDWADAEAEIDAAFGAQMPFSNRRRQP